MNIEQKLAEYRRQQEALRQVAQAQYEARCEQERRENLAGWAWLLPVLGAVLGVGWAALWVFQSAVELLFF